MEELKKLQDELRGINVMELNEEEYQIFKAKSDRVNQLIHELYEII